MEESLEDYVKMEEMRIDHICFTCNFHSLESGNFIDRIILKSS